MRRMEQSCRTNEHEPVVLLLLFHCLHVQHDDMSEEVLLALVASTKKQWNIQVIINSLKKCNEFLRRFY